MRAKLCSVTVLLFFLCLVGVTSRHFVHNDDFALNKTSNIQVTVQDPKSLKTNSTPTEGKRTIEEAKYRGINKIGSRPPSCEHKCYGCMPCEAIQVPTTTARVGVQYTNYEPEGWKCKCGPAFYSP